METITPGQLPAWFDRTKRKHVHAVLVGLRAGADLGRGMVVERSRRVRPFPAVNTGHYVASWDRVNLPTGALVFNSAPYAGIIEWGVRPNRIPLPKLSAKGAPIPMRAILRWTYLKFKSAVVYRKRKGAWKWGKKTVFKAEKSAWGLAVAIQRKLHARGIKGRRVLTHPAFVARLREVAQREIVLALERAVGGG